MAAADGTSPRPDRPGPGSVVSRAAEREDVNVAGRHRDAPGNPGDPPVLPHPDDAGLLRLGDGVQPARHRPVGAQPPLRQLLRLVRRPPPERVRARASGSPRAFESIEEICNYLLGHKEVVDLRRRPRGGGKAVVPDVRRGDRAARRASSASRSRSRRAALRHRLDSKIETTRIGRRGRRAQRPQRARPGDDVRGAAGAGRDRPGSGDDLVVQTPYGDSGQTTFFIADARPTGTSTRRRSSDEELKVMRRINAAEAAIEGVITRHGTLVGPLMTELAGLPRADALRRRLVRQRRARLDVLTEDAAARSRASAPCAMGERLRQEGYRGYFELDFLADVDTGEMYLGELNPRVTGRELDDERHRRRLRRHAAVPVPPARVHGRRLRDRRRRAERALGAAAEHRRVEPVHPQADRRRGRAASRSAPASGIWRMAPDGSIGFVAPRHRLAHGRRRATRRSTCASPAPATTATRAPTSASS